MNHPQITLGSLFDGIGAVPLAASYFGIKPLWASEILSNAVSVTRRHFPNMAHLGDITKLDGGKIPPVHIIAFGSPCQSFSVAGNRTGLAGKSGLFLEAIRIIREMRCATHGRYPEIVLFENVPGLLSSGGSGRDYQTVLEAFTETEIPMPRSGRWANAGMVRGRGIDLAWLIKDASKHFRVPQRRRRLFLVADFTDRRAAEILFVSQSLSGYFAARAGEGEGTSASVAGGVGGAVAVLNDQGGSAISVEKEALSPTLRSQTHGNLPIICSAFMAGQSQDARSIAYSETLSPTLKGSPSGSNQMPCVCAPAYTMRLREGCAGGGKGPLIQAEKSGTLATGNDQTLFFPCGEPLVHPTTTGTLCGSGAGLSRPAGMASETDLCVAYCEAAYGGYCVKSDAASTLRASGGSCGGGSETLISSVDCRNFRENEISGTIQAKSTGGYSLHFQNPIRIGYAVRRLTPLEAERLMALPDGWTEYGHDGKPMSDSARYQMCGNSIVVNCLAYIMQNIAGHMNGGKGVIIQ